MRRHRTGLREWRRDLFTLAFGFEALHFETPIPSISVDVREAVERGHC